MHRLHVRAHELYEMNKVIGKRRQEVMTMHDYYSPEVKLLLVTHSNEKEKMRYDDNPNLWLVPKIGPRPPYYCNPRYEQYYPII
ncbi:hypothetical protein NSQ77_14440 [Oceanobacillus sp. FSL K6-2867]|uniref:hypothetical protein n=1 Tax=Oceanobacillus sp. FSL K6-2867 TaxID=2954748 RepID=UPI0030DCC058